MSDEKKYRTEVPNIIDDLGLDPYERTLYVHYKRVCGADGGQCTEGVRKIAEKTKMSVGKITQARKSLLERGLITGDVQQGKDSAIACPDIWDINTAYYADKNRPNVDGWGVEQLRQWANNCSPDEQLNGHNSSLPEHLTPDCSPDEQHCSPDEQKKEPIKKDSPFRDGEPSSTPKEVKETKEPTVKQLEAQAMFKALADLCQYDLDLISKKERGELNQAEKKMRENGYTPDDLKGFKTWWYAEEWRGKLGQAPNLSQVRSTWGQYKNHLTGGNGRDSPPKTRLVIVPVDSVTQESNR